MATRPTFTLTGKVEVKVIRPGEIRNEYGKPVEDPPTEHYIEANIQPLRFKEIQLLPEADRTKEWIKLYLDPDQDLRGELEGTPGQRADIIEWAGHQYKVMNIRSWNMGVLNHIEARAARIPISGGPI